MTKEKEHSASQFSGASAALQDDQGAAPRCVLSFDVEDWHQGFVSRGIEGWQKFGSRERQNVDRILVLLEQFKTSATFFVLGQFAREHPDVVRIIAEAGHEIASHTDLHKPLPSHTPATFREDLRQSVSTLEDLTGRKVLGYRAVSWSMQREAMWALDIMLEEGLIYDSSIFPTSAHKYGFPEAPTFPHRIVLPSGSSIIEFPAQVLELGFLRLPVAGGFYLRAFPFIASLWGIEQSMKRGRTGMVYLHPYDLDVEVPRLDTPLVFRVIRYYNLAQTEPRLRILLQRFKFSSIQSVISQSGSNFPVIPSSQLGGRS